MSGSCTGNRNHGVVVGTLYMGTCPEGLSDLQVLFTCSAVGRITPVADPRGAMPN